MKVDTKFNLGDIVTFGYVDRVETTCPICDGTQRIVYKDRSFRCPECQGYGFILLDTDVQLEGIITVVDVRQTANDTTVWYEVAYKDNGYDDNAVVKIPKSKNIFTDSDLSLVRRGEL